MKGADVRPGCFLTNAKGGCLKYDTGKCGWPDICMVRKPDLKGVGVADKIPGKESEGPIVRRW